MKTKSKSLTLRITEVEGNMYQLNYSRRKVDTRGGYDWIMGYERFIFQDGQISWSSEKDLQDLLRKVAMSKSALIEYISKSF
jgi:hypothetical protein